MVTKVRIGRHLIRSTPKGIRKTPDMHRKTSHLIRWLKDGKTKGGKARSRSKSIGKGKSKSRKPKQKYYRQRSRTMFESVEPEPEDVVEKIEWMSKKAKDKDEKVVLMLMIFDLLGKMRPLDDFVELWPKCKKMSKGKLVQVMKYFHLPTRSSCKQLKEVIEKEDHQRKKLVKVGASIKRGIVAEVCRQFKGKEKIRKVAKALGTNTDNCRTLMSLFTTKLRLVSVANNARALRRSRRQRVFATRQGAGPTRRRGGPHRFAPRWQLPRWRRRGRCRGGGVG